MTKEGSPWLRTVMVEAAHVTVRSSPILSGYRDRIAARHGRNAAKVAVARKLLTAIFWMLRRQEPYRDNALTRASPVFGLVCETLVLIGKLSSDRYHVPISTNRWLTHGAFQSAQGSTIFTHRGQLLLSASFMLQRTCNLLTFVLIGGRIIHRFEKRMCKITYFVLRLVYTIRDYSRVRIDEQTLLKDGALPFATCVPVDCVSVDLVSYVRTGTLL